ncbi:MAG: UDP-N-acetylmuramoyl-tripeptide--D-alanyl-D-alanine ligase [Gammaproteobacteria bacterium]|nr:UDP-N-acetylmuramoyl-tripeptide--D-alanyl-D-alanine ligase [Gammaproteobacteria bacterium]MCP4088601.1 UDP-N-acetylmuramoyl-tripeptide--D-alanyl-D-alanine ligase [Gammaproteobacteria bacterium]MCP4276491.1 UDP-N-acetylmuramoyl-tripeptide--D-alanyl-D-alanine ligase [Gammaproteobacteria bacterium]MCP4832368.1 UDP-N-acetylmuramoyl-tripeptide--D-alanyl-D-alanine ligase [Gammaproteobacteria bacterium]
MSMGTLIRVAQDIDGRLQGPDASFESVSTDTRTIGPGQLFFALRGERYDARKFVADAADKGAAGAVVEQFAEVELSQIAVGDSRLALGLLARKWRQHFDLPVIGVTGSNGKTTVKELTASIMRVALSEHGDDVVLATTGNLNNDIGLPLTLLGLRDFHKAAVIEMGANHPGEIAVLADIAAVNIAVITNAARAHLEGFGRIEDVAQTKGELLDALSGKETAILNRDDAFFSDWAARIGSAQLCTFGLSEDADVWAEQVQLVVNDGQPVFKFDLIAPAGRVAVSLPLAGQHNVMNALAAAAAALAAGATLNHVQAGLAASCNVPGRLRAFQVATGATVYDDSYNANPDSVSAAISFLEELSGEPWLVLGDMGELGPDSAALHRDMGELARDAGIHALFCIGDMSRETAAGFGAGARWFETAEALEKALRPELVEGRNVLIKGSRFMALDQLVGWIESSMSVSHEGEG